MTISNLPTELLADPFFLQTKNKEWNACIGNQGKAIYYVDGYIDAALALVCGIIDRNEYAKRDTMIMPILYIARHGIELSLKYVIDELVRIHVLPSGHRKNHDILSHFTFLEDKKIGDRSFREILRKLKPW